MRYLYQWHDNEWWRMPANEYLSVTGPLARAVPLIGGEKYVPDANTGGKLALMLLVQPGTTVEGIGYRWYIDEWLIELAAREDEE